jgi:hypothetical protein
MLLFLLTSLILHLALPLHCHLNPTFKGTQSNIRMLRYSTEMPNAGMPMPAALVSSRCPDMLSSNSTVLF